MFCNQCGKELTIEQKFCPNCGCSNSQQRQTTREILIRRAHEFSQTYDVSLDIPGLSVWEFSKIDGFDPLNKLSTFKQDLLRDLMAFSKYEFSQENLEEIIEETYPTFRKILLTNLKKWFLDQCAIFIDETGDDFVYNIVEIANCAIKRVYGLSRYLTIVNCELQDWEGLQFTKSFLKIAEKFYCKNSESYGRQFIRNGQLLRLYEFSEAKHRYDDLMNQINTSIVMLNPQIKTEIEQEMKANEEKELTIKKRGKNSILTRVICGLIFPLLLMLQSSLFPQFDSVSLPITIIVGAILYGLLLSADFTVQNIPLIIILNVIGLLLFCPICLLMSSLVAWLSKIFVFIIGGIIILFVFFFHGDRMNP